jgi:GNAT superfamily N-acetyltransferase
MIFQKAKSKTMFKPSFGNKKGQTDFYQILIDNKPVAEIEIKPSNKFGKPEILSAFTDDSYRGMGLGKMLVSGVLELYLKDELHVLTTKESKPFWIKMGAHQTDEWDGFMCKFKN